MQETGNLGNNFEIYFHRSKVLFAPVAPVGLWQVPQRRQPAICVLPDRIPILQVGTLGQVAESTRELHCKHF
jgi:hypothetical protein